MRLQVTVTGRAPPHLSTQGGVTGKLSWPHVEPSALPAVFAEIAQNVLDAPLFAAGGCVEVLVQQSHPEEGP